MKKIRLMNLPDEISLILVYQEGEPLVFRLGRKTRSVFVCNQFIVRGMPGARWQFKISPHEISGNAIHAQIVSHSGGVEAIDGGSYLGSVGDWNFDLGRKFPAYDHDEHTHRNLLACLFTPGDPEEYLKHFLQIKKGLWVCQTAQTENAKNKNRPS